MTDRIEIKVLDDQTQQALNNLHYRVSNLRQLMGALAEDMMSAVENNFAAEGRPAKWPKLHPGTIEDRQKKGYWPGKILQRTGQLLASIHPEYNASEAIVGTNKIYAAIHQFGGQTKAHVIRAKNKKFLAFRGKDGGMVFRRSVNHPGSKIPARPFLSLTDDDMANVMTILESYLVK